MCTLKLRRFEGVKTFCSSFSLSSSALVQRYTYFPAARQFLDQFADVGVEQRLAAGDADDGGAALLHCGQALLDGQSALEHVRRVLDLPRTPRMRGCSAAAAPA